MDELKNKRVYKVISLFIKSVILILSLYYIYDKIDHAPMVLADLPFLFSKENSVYTLLILLLMLVNWSIEALKWKILIAPLETITFLSSYKAVLTGVTVSIF